MNLTDAVYGVLITCALYGCGWVTRGWHEDQKPKPPPRVEFVPYRVGPATLLGCPITREGLEEWGRTCRARKRTTAVKPRGRM